MSQVFGYLCSDDSLTAEVMRQYGQPLSRLAPEERMGLGIGWLQDGRSLLRKHPERQAAAVEIPLLLADIPTRAMVGHIRHRDMGRAGALQLQPFRFRDWVWAQRGTKEAPEEVYQALMATVPDHVQRNIKGTSLAELLFHIFYTKVESELSRTAQNEWPTLFATKMAETMRRLERLSKENGDEERSSLLAVAVTDRYMVASRLGAPLHYRVVEGIEEPGEEPLFAGHRPRTIKHDRFRAVLVANHVDEPGWEEIPERHVMWVDAEWNIGFIAI